MIKLIAIDLDGTLIGSNSEISEKDEKSVRKCIKSGIKVVIVSAKSILAVMNIVNRFGLEDPQIAFGGAAIIYPEHSKREYKIIPELYCREVIDYSRNMNKTICIGTTDGCFYFEKYHSSLEEISKGGEVLKKTDDLTSTGIINNTLLMTVILKSNDKFNNLLIHKFHNRLRVVRGGKYFLDISDLKASKAGALKKVSQKLNIERSEIMAIGDSEGDIGIIKFAGIGIAMGNSSRDVMKTADYITYSNDSDGVYHIINNIIFNKGNVLDKKMMMWQRQSAK